MTLHFRHPEALVTGAWLEAHLDDPQLRVFDCTTYLEFDEGGTRPYRVVSGRPGYEDGHIPGSGYLDLQRDFSAADSRFGMTLPTMEHAARAFEREGVADGTRVVLYSRTTMPWATRFWWMLRWLGFDNASILDGGYSKWLADGRAVSTEPATYLPGSLSIDPRPGLFVGRDDVLAAIGRSDTCTINALSPELHRGENPRYGRPGRIPGSLNVPAASLFDPESSQALDSEAIAQAFTFPDLVPSKRVITYCGGGIFATLDAFFLHQLGYSDIAVYDNSMSEWAADERLPLETG